MTDNADNADNAQPLQAPIAQTYTIRRATPDDALIVATHRKRMWEDMGYRGEPTLDDALLPSVAWFAQAMHDGRYRHFLAVIGESIAAGAGFFIDARPPDLWDLDGTRAHVVGVYTEPGYRGRGLASALMQAVLADCAVLHVRQITLNASDQGRPIYHNLGFENVPNMMRLWLHKD